MKLFIIPSLILLNLFFINDAFANNGAHWSVRSGIVIVNPNDNSSNVLSNDDGVTVDNASAVGLSFTYHFDDVWGVELLTASPFSHDITGTGSLKGLAIGDTKHLPPTLSLIYKWGDNYKYHVGVGVNHTVFFDTNSNDALTSALSANTTDIDLKSSTGVAFKFGFDMPISKNWSLSANAYWVDIDTKADVIVNGNVATTVAVELDPWVYMLGVSVDF